MQKRILYLLLSMILVLSLGTSALAADTAPSPSNYAASTPADSSKGATIEERLSEVTLIVKETLGIGDKYTNFYGNLNDKGIRQIWTLNWSDENESLTVYADQTGKVLYYSRDTYSYDYRYSNDFAPKFPSVTREQAQVVAETFLRKILEKNETCDLNTQSGILNPADVDRYYFNGTLKLNGLDSPINVSISVSTSDQKVSYFSRSDNYSEYIGTLPTASPVTSKDKAAELLAGTVKMKLQYVLADAAAKSGPTAVLRYLPVSTGSYVVNAKTGKLIDIRKLMDDINRGLEGGYGTAENSMAASADKATLSPVEQEGIAKLEGVLTKEQLDSKARAITELGILPDYTFNNISYSLNNETGEVTAYLYYSLRIDPKSKESTSASSADKDAIRAAAGDYVTFINKTLALDAKTGTFKSVYTNYPYSQDYANLKRDTDKLKTAAEAFLSKYFGEYIEKSAVYEDTDAVIPYYYYDYKNYSPSEPFTYCQIENGYFFPVNRLNISVNAETGYIDSFSMSWTENVTFESPDGIISNAEACSKYAAAYETKLSYVSLPVEIDPSRPDLKPYAELGYTYLYELILGYTHYSQNYITGVSAKTGEVIFTEPYQEKGISEYKDIKGHWAEAQIRKLSQYGIGFPGESFKPNASLTQLDMVILLMSADGYRFNNENPTQDEINQLYEAAYYRNILKKQDKNPTKVMTRSDVVHTLLTMSGYSKTADLKGIYICKFNDASSISEADYGYFAIAQGLGIIKGDANGNANPYSVVTRVEAAIMLYNFMSR